MFEDFFKALKERANNPIAGAFGISFVFINWRIFSHLFLSDASIDERLRAIERLSDGWLILYVWGCPIVFALAYVIGMPWVSMKIEEYRQRGTDKLIQVKKSQEPRLELIEKLNADNLTLEDALKIARPKDANKVREAVREFNSQFLAYSNSKQYLKPEERKKIEECVTKIDEVFLKFLGTPLGINKLDQTTDQQ